MSLLERLKNNLSAPTSAIENKAANSAASTVVEISASATSFVCKNHFVMYKGKQNVKRVILSFIPGETERICECGIIYKRVKDY